MTRIIAGFAGSQRLRVPGSGTRPTSDRVREAIFSALDARDQIYGACVLDLFAGSGALGLEAASRGAVAVTLVERNRAAAAVAKTNVKIIESAAEASLLGTQVPRMAVAIQTVQNFLEASSGSYDVVFIDPPYDVGEDELGQVLTALVIHLDDHAVVVVERSTRSPEPSWPTGLTVQRRTDYGETVLWWAAPT